MPTRKHAMVRQLLKRGRTRVVSREPFSIQLNYGTTENTQKVNLVVDCGTSHVGISATSHRLDFGYGKASIGKC
ncbi:MAG: RRXRR domain-containing protein [Alistipes sp.]|nr:RRXRR domain-containing protein [Candidatus Alistipes equi]